jgi:hypothetical protein
MSSIKGMLKIFLEKFSVRIVGTQSREKSKPKNFRLSDSMIQSSKIKMIGDMSYQLKLISKYQGSFLETQNLKVGESSLSKA